jgi:UV excision repair protein RAD23
MKVTLKTIKDGQFTLDLDASSTVGALKAAIEAEKGQGYAAGALKVIYQGKVLADDATLESTGYKEADFLVVMATKAKAKPAAAPAAAQAASEPAAASSAAAPAATGGATSMDSAPDTETGASDEASGDSDLPRELPASSPLAFLAANRNFVQMRGMVQQQPHLLPSLLQQIGAANPELVQLINENQEDFYILLNAEDEEGGDMGMGMPGPPQPGMQLTPEENEAIERLCALGFDRALAMQAYFACEKNENLAANWLLSNGDFQ